uniref:Ig-like domain-containing protein n=1 Tax=Magallana gigas TaxID=29159 RepID=A0A8W8P2G9_MAGGI
MIVATKQGCLTLGYYGEKCSTPCPKNCKGGDCHIVAGTCISCVHGYTGSICNKVCGACYEKEQCDFKNGTCPSGCEDGYKGRQCKTVCNNNTYGPNCSMTCGHCLYLYGEKCNHVTGQCPRGCASGFQGDLCVESRDEFKNKTTVAWPTYNGQGPPSITSITITPSHYHYGDDVQLTCDVKSNPMYYSLGRNMMATQNHIPSNINAENSLYKAVIRIKHLARDNLRQYQCYVQNSFGQDIQTITLTAPK